LQETLDMRTLTLPLPTFGFIVATRAALAAGLALLLADRLGARQRTRTGLALFTLGAATTIPAAWWVSRSRQRSRPSLAVASSAERNATSLPESAGQVVQRDANLN
jgi:hypothetical protein